MTYSQNDKKAVCCRRRADIFIIKSPLTKLEDFFYDSSTDSLTKQPIKI